MRRALFLAVLAGCSPPSPGKDAGVDAGIDAGPLCLDPDGGVDAGHTQGDGGDFSCAGAALPPGAVADLTVSGFVTLGGLTRTPVAGALVELFSASGTQLSSTVTTVDGGLYSVSSPTGCQPLDGYMRASNSDAGWYDIYYYPGSPWRQNRAELELVVLDQAARNLAAFLANVTIQNDTAALALGVDDCAGDPVSGATVTSVPAGDVRYVAPNGIPTSTDMATTTKGQLLIFNLPPGNVSITAMARGQTFKTKTVNARVNAITSTTLTP